LMYRTSCFVSNTFLSLNITVKLDEKMRKITKGVCKTLKFMEALLMS
jgi:hypothetical protein